MSTSVFDSVFRNGGFASMKAAPPSNKKTPKAIQQLSILHHGQTTDKEIDAIINEFKNMSPESYEYSRLGILFSIEHILDQLNELRYGFGSLVSFSSAIHIFTGIFNNMIDYFEEMKSIKSKNFNKKMIEAEVEAIITFAEGIMFLKETAKKDTSLLKLIPKYENYQQELLNSLHTHQQALKILKPEYETVTDEYIFKTAKQEMELSMSFDYSSLRCNTLERIIICVGDKKDYWYALQNEDKWKELYSNEYQSLRDDSLVELRSQLPLIFEQYKNLHYLSFTNIVKTLILSSIFYGDKMSARNESQPQNEQEYQHKESTREETIKHNEKEFFRPPYVHKTQTPEITHENLKFAGEILASAMTVDTLIDEVCGLSDNQELLILEKYSAEHDVVRKTNSDIALILFKDHAHINGFSISVTDLEKGNVKSYDELFGKAKSSSFYSMSHFLREIQEAFVQEHFFGKNDKVLKFVDKRTA